MTTPNPFGVNQLGEAHVPYGQVKQAKQLAREAPMSGAPVATSALNTPQRARKPKQRPQPQAQQQPVATVAPPPMTLTQRAVDIGSIPGASFLVQQLAKEAVSEAAGP